MLGSHEVFVPGGTWMLGSSSHPGNCWVPCTLSTAQRILRLHPKAVMRAAGDPSVKPPVVPVPVTIAAQIAPEVGVDATVTTPDPSTSTVAPLEFADITLVISPEQTPADTGTETAPAAPEVTAVVAPVEPEAPAESSLFSEDPAPATIPLADVVRTAVPKLAEDVLAAAVALIETKPEDLTTALQTIKGIGASTAKKIAEALNVK